MTRKDSFTPPWFEGTLPQRSYRSAFKWGDPDAYKHPNPRLYDLMKETFGLDDEHFKKPHQLGLEEVSADAPISLSPEQVREALAAGYLLPYDGEVIMTDAAIAAGVFP